MKKRIVISAAIFLSILLAGCASAPDPLSRMDDGNPLSLLAAGVIAHEIQSDPKATAADKAEAHDALYEAAYKYARATGLKRWPARRVARSFADDTPLPDLTCADYAIKPPDCQTPKQRVADQR